MAGLGLCQRSEPAPSWMCHFESVSTSSTRSHCHSEIYLCPNLAKHQDQLRGNLFPTTSSWWDSRLVKTSDLFKSKGSRKRPWVRNQSKPLRFVLQLASVDAELQTGIGGLQMSSDRSSVPTDKEPQSKNRQSAHHPVNYLVFDSQLHTSDAQLQHGPGGLEGSSVGGTFVPSFNVRSPFPQKTGFLVSRYKSLLKACIKSKSLSQARRVYADLAKDGLELSKHLGETVVSTLVKCGGLEDGLQLFHKLPKRTVVSWTAVISGFIQGGQCKEALRMYSCMVEEGVHPNEYTIASILKACGTLGNLEKGKCIHADAVKYGCESDLFVGTSLVDMYAKCGSMTDAHTVFDGLSQRDVVSWTTMLTGCAQQGHGKMVLHLFQRMQEEGVSPNDWTFVSAIQACGSLAEKEDAVLVGGALLKVESMQRGKAIHAESQQRGFDSDVFIGSSLVSMYAKCGSIADAQAVFDRLSTRNVVLWTTMVASYVQRSQAEKALHLYEQMRIEGVIPNARTVVSVLQACCILAEKEDFVLVDGQWLKPEALQKAKAIHAEAKKRGEDDSFVGSSMINTYGKCGSTTDAEIVFDGLLHPDVVSWTAIHVAYVQQDLGGEALHVYEEMQKQGVSPNNWTFVSTLQACGSLAEKEDIVSVNGELLRVESLQQGTAIHAEARRRGCCSDVYVGYALVSMYGKCGSIRCAHLVFDGLSHRDVVAWNAMLAGYSQQGQGALALDLYEEMRVEAVSPDDRTFVSVLQACCSIAEQEATVFVDGEWLKVESLKIGKAVHAEAHSYGFESDVFVANTLVSLYGKCGSMVDARVAFDGLTDRDVVTWNAMLSAYARHSQSDMVLQLYGQMAAEGVRPDDTTLVCVLQACGNAGALSTCMQMHSYIISTRNLHLANALIQAYGKCARMEDAKAVFAALPQPNVVSWNELIAGYTRNGNHETSLLCFEEMLQAHVQPDAVTFLSVLSSCSHAGLVDRGVDLLESMERDHGISPEIEHYVAVVDLLGRAGLFSAVEDLLSKMPMQPDMSLWKCLLNACRKHGNVMLGKRAFDSAVNLQPKSSAAYALMSNIYGQAGMWEQVERLRVVAGPQKEPEVQLQTHQPGDSELVFHRSALSLFCT